MSSVYVVLVIGLDFFIFRPAGLFARSLEVLRAVFFLGSNCPQHCFLGLASFVDEMDVLREMLARAFPRQGAS